MVCVRHGAKKPRSFPAKALYFRHGRTFKHANFLGVLQILFTTPLLHITQLEYALPSPEPGTRKLGLSSSSDEHWPGPHLSLRFFSSHKSDHVLHPHQENTFIHWSMPRLSALSVRSPLKTMWTNTPQSKFKRTFETCIYDWLHLPSCPTVTYPQQKKQE